MTRPVPSAEAAHSLILRCASVTLALPLALVVEVVLVVAPAAPLLRMPRYCLGVIDYHGQLAPLIDLAARLGLSPPRTTLELAEGRIVILRGRSGLFGYLTDEVLELCEAPVEPLPDGEPGSSALYGQAGLICGMVRYRADETVPLLVPGALVPMVAGERLRKAVAALTGAPAAVPLAVEGPR